MIVGDRWYTSHTPLSPVTVLPVDYLYTGKPGNSYIIYNVDQHTVYHITNTDHYHEIMDSCRLGFGCQCMLTIVSMTTLVSLITNAYILTPETQVSLVTNMYYPIFQWMPLCFHGYLCILTLVFPWLPIDINPCVPMVTY